MLRNSETGRCDLPLRVCDINPCVIHDMPCGTICLRRDMPSARYAFGTICLAARYAPSTRKDTVGADRIRPPHRNSLRRASPLCHPEKPGRRRRIFSHFAHELITLCSASPGGSARRCGSRSALQVFCGRNPDARSRRPSSCRAACPKACKADGVLCRTR